MSAAYRRKLVDWLTSMLVLLLIVVVTLLYGWMKAAYYLQEFGFNNVDWFLHLIGEALLSYIIFFVLLWFWHFADFIEQMTWTNRLLVWLMGYPLLVTLLLLIGASTLFNQSGWLNDLGCPEVVNPPGTFTFDGCGSVTPWWKEMIGIALIFALLFISFSKLVVVLAFHTIRLSKKALSLLQQGNKITP